MNKKDKILMLLILIEFVLIIVSTKSFDNGNVVEHDLKNNDGMFTYYVIDENEKEIKMQESEFPKEGFKIKKVECKNLKGDKIDNIDISVNSNYEIVVNNLEPFSCDIYILKKPEPDLTIEIDNTISENINCNIGGDNNIYNDRYNRYEILIDGAQAVGKECSINVNKSVSNDGTLLSKLTNPLLPELTTLTHTINDKPLTSYRYTGKTPNNYLWFNEEMWRIIGVVPACTTASDGVCSEYTNLVKIMRDESLSTISFDGVSPTDSTRTTVYEDSTLKEILNSYYCNSLIAPENPETGCYGHENANKINCNYTDVGLKKVQSYIESVYWNVGAITSLSKTSSEVYIDELKNASIHSSYVGLPSPSDYGYATTKGCSASTDICYDIDLSKYAGEPSSYDWLYGKGEIWTINPAPSNGNVAYISASGNIEKNYSSSGYQVHPVVYLKSDVGWVSGDGSKNTPYRVIK